MQFLEDILSFVKSLSMIDIILYFAVLVLFNLIISLIYVIKTSEEEDGEEETKPFPAISFPKVKVKPKESKEPMNLKEIVNSIDEMPKPVIDMTAYETEQEEKAIISYDELVNTAKFHPINYDTDELINNEVRVKKVNLEQITNPNMEEEPPKVEVKLFQYEREELFLKTLQQLNELLN